MEACPASHNAMMCCMIAELGQCEFPQAATIKKSDKPKDALSQSPLRKSGNLQELVEQGR
jgi:hypothetical protein